MCRRKCLSAFLALVFALIPLIAGAQDTQADLYKTATGLFEAGSYDEALPSMIELGGYGESRRYVKYILGQEALKADALDDAQIFFSALGDPGFLDSAQLGRYATARALEAQGELRKAYELYATLDVRDSIERELTLLRRIGPATPSPTPAPTPAPTPRPTPSPTPAPRAAGMNELIMTTGAAETVFAFESASIYAPDGDSAVLSLRFNSEDNSQTITLDFPLSMNDPVSVSQRANDVDDLFLYGIDFTNVGDTSASYKASTSTSGQQAPDPEGSDYSIRLEPKLSGREYTGEFSTTLVDVDGANPPIHATGSFRARLSDEEYAEIFPMGIFEGYEGESVRRVQQWLIDNGYLDGKADGKFGKATLTAMKDFYAVNELTALDCITPDAQRYMFNGYPEKYKEPVFPLSAGDNSTGEWRSIGKSQMKFHFKVKSIARRKTISSYTICVVPVDASGNPLTGDGLYYSIEVKATIKPGKTVYTDYVTFGNRKKVARVYANITDVTYTDGTSDSSLDNYSNLLMPSGIYWDIDW